MALVPTICVTLSDDCTTAYFFETTGAYNATSNLTGYGAPNNATSDFTTATITVLLAGSTVAETAIDVFNLSTQFPTSVNTRARQIDAADFGLTEFPVGLTRFTYRITGSSIAFRADKLILANCDYKCAVDKMLLAIAKNPESCACEDSRITDWMYAQSMLEGAQLATCCGDVATVTADLAILETLTNNNC